MVLGAGLAPGLSTVLVSTVRSRPDDALDVTIMVGSGDKHGVAAMAWIARLVGTEIADSCDVGGARNFREHRWFGDPAVDAAICAPIFPTTPSLATPVAYRSGVGSPSAVPLPPERLASLAACRGRALERSDLDVREEPVRW
jgi:hypothetical protein